MTSAAEVFIARFGFTEAARHAVAVADERGIDRAVAAVLLDKESNARNIWGHDSVDTCGNYTKGGPVTEDDYRAYKADRARCGMQGCGPVQLTWWALQDRATNWAVAGAWSPT